MLFGLLPVLVSIISVVAGFHGFNRTTIYESCDQIDQIYFGNTNRNSITN